MRNESMQGISTMPDLEPKLEEMEPFAGEFPLRYDPSVPRILSEFNTLAEALDYAAKTQAGFRFYGPRGQHEHTLTYPDLRKRAVSMARKLLASGLERGERVAMVAETRPDFMVAFFACQYAGLVPCPMPYTMYIGGRDAYIERVGGMLRAAHASAAITTEGLLDHVTIAAYQAGVAKVWCYEDFDTMPEGETTLSPFKADETAYIQYSSGSTSSPKGVLISQRAIMANAKAIMVSGLDVRLSDRAFSWLPLYHDMGLVGFWLAPLTGQTSIDYIATSSFARRPALWLKLMSENKTTICYAPSFGYELAARRINGDAKTLDLSHWRVAGIGGDMVRPDILELFSEKLEVAQFDSKAFVPSYGMAESTLAVTFYDVDSPLKIDVVDRARYKLSRRAVPSSLDPKLYPEKVRSFVVCGAPLPDHEIRIRDENGRELGEREIGHVLIKGPSLMSGYFRDPEATQEIMIGDGFMDTGDMGYWLDGQIVITGRSKDLILHNGRNIWPQDIEWAAEQIEPLKTGDVAAFAVDADTGEQEVTVLVQCRMSSIDEMEKLRHEVSSVVHQTAGVDCQIVLVPPRSLPFTSSGKLSRAGAKMQYLAGDIMPIETDEPEPVRLRAVAG